MLMLILGIILLVGGVLGAIKPELMMGKKNLNGTEQENQKKLKNMRILSIVLAVFGILMLFGVI